jgi:hypothetical protein
MEFLIYPILFFESSQKQRVIVSNQWASHPERKEREAKLNALGWETPITYEPASLLFDNIEALQQQLTDKLYSTVQWKDEPQLMESSQFKSEQQQKRDYYAYPDIYRNYYDGRYVAPFNPQKVFEKSQGTYTGLSEILTEEHFGIHAKMSALQDDISRLQAVHAEGSDIRSFDFEGTKFPASEADRILEKLETEIALLTSMQTEADEKLASLAMHNYHDSNIAKQKYADFFQFGNACKELTDAVQTMFDRLQPLMQGQQYSIDDANILANYLKSTDLIAIGNAWRMLGASPLFNLQPEFRNAITAMLIKDYVFFNGESFLDMEINEVMQHCDVCYQMIQNNLFAAHKDLLVWQAENLSK